MSNNSSSDQEIDLGQLMQKIKNSFNSISDLIFDFILFIKKNVIILSLLVVIGFAAGILLSKATKSYDHKIIITPNFRSIEYVQNKIDLINSKITEKDAEFFNSLNIPNYKNIKSIKVEPITDIFGFIGEDEVRLEMVKLLADNGDINNVLKENTLSRYYHSQIIEINTNKSIKREEVIDPILKFINDSEYYSQIKNIALSTTQEKIKANDSTIVSINKILNSYSKNNASEKTNSVYYSNNTQLADIIEQKASLLKEQTNLQVDLINEVSVVKEISSTINIIDVQKSNDNLLYILPGIFVLIFIISRIFINFYKSQIKKRKLL